MLDISKKLHKIFTSIDPYAIHNSDYDYDEADGENFSTNPLVDFVQSPVGQVIEDVYTTINKMDPYKYRNNNYDYDEADGENFAPNPFVDFVQNSVGQVIEDIHTTIDMMDPYKRRNDNYDYDEADGENFAPNPFVDFVQNSVGQVVEDVYTTIDMMDPYKRRNDNYDYDEADGENFYDPASRFEETPMGKRAKEIMNMIKYSNPYLKKDSSFKTNIKGANDEKFLQEEIVPKASNLSFMEAVGDVFDLTPSFENVSNVPDYRFMGLGGDNFPTFAPDKTKSAFEDNIFANKTSNDNSSIWQDPDDSNAQITNIYQNDNITNTFQFGDVVMQTEMDIQEFGQKIANILNEASKNRRNV